MNLKISSIIFCIFAISLVYTQEKTLLDLAKRNQINNIPNSVDELRYQTFNYYLTDIDALGEGKFYNNALLNNYFKSVITSYATNTGDLSFNNFFLQANSSAGTLTIGKSFRLDNMLASKENQKALKNLRPLQKLENLLTVYIKSSYRNGFSTLYSEDSDTEEYNFNNNIGVGIKYTYVGDGWVNVVDTDTNKIKDLRNNNVKGAVLSKINAYVKNQFKSDLALMNYGITDIKKKRENERKLIEKKYFEFYNTILEEELKYAESQNLIKSSGTHWISVEGFIPLTETEIQSSTNNVDIITDEFKSYNFNVTVNYLYNLNNTGFFKDTSAKLTVQGSHFNTNTFIANNQSAVSFQNVIQNNGNTIVQGGSDSVFLGMYDDFWATSLKGELVVLLFNNSIGLSGAVEEIYGDVENRNWKLGIPFSLKDKEGKPTVNFELQWRELYDTHSVGLSVGYNFGKFVK